MANRKGYPKPLTRIRLDLARDVSQNRWVLRTLLRYASVILATVPALFRTHRDQAIVELALRQQLAVYAHKRSRPRLTPLDRVFWIALSHFWLRWKASSVIVQPETVVRWHRKGFRLYQSGDLSRIGPLPTPKSSGCRVWEDSIIVTRGRWPRDHSDRGPELVESGWQTNSENRQVVGIAVERVEPASGRITSQGRLTISEME